MDVFSLLGGLLIGIGIGYFFGNRLTQARYLTIMRLAFDESAKKKAESRCSSFCNCESKKD